MRDEVKLHLALLFKFSLRATLAALVACENDFSPTRLHKLSHFRFQFTL